MRSVTMSLNYINLHFGARAAAIYSIIDRVCSRTAVWRTLERALEMMRSHFNAHVIIDEQQRKEDACACIFEMMLI